jgi:hypothetical protein
VDTTTDHATTRPAPGDRELPTGLRALSRGVAKSGNAKIGNAATTYSAQTSCPASCPFFAGGGCYAEQGRLGKTITAPLNEAAAAVDHTPLDVALAEAAAIDGLVVSPGRPLRLHTVGDCASDEAARTVAAAAARYRERGGGPVWTYTHAWRDVARESWGEVSVLASCETAADVAAARARGYATELTVDHFEDARRHKLTASEGGPSQAGVDVLPCPEQTRGRTCSECRLCFDDRALYERDYSIALSLHGTAFTLRQATKALHTPNDPNRKLTTRQLIPPTVAEMRTKGEVDADGAIANTALARELACNPSSIAEMRRRLAREAIEAGEADAAIAERLGWSRAKMAAFRRTLPA